MKNYYKIDELHYPHSLVSERHVSVECARHMHISPEIVLVSEGELNMCIGGNDYTIKKGEGTFIPPFTPHSFSSPNYNICHVVTFAGELLAHISNFVKTRAVKKHLFPISEPIMSLVDYYLPEMRNTVDDILAQAVLSPMYYEILNGCTFSETVSASDDTLLRALEYMNAHYDAEITLETVATRAGIHPVTLSRLFTERTGITFSHYLKYLRARHALALIKNTTDSFTSIALSSGFGSVRSFNRAFFEFYGDSPSSCRRKTNPNNRQ